jgi:hypothetical protein
MRKPLVALAGCLILASAPVLAQPPSPASSPPAMAPAAAPGGVQFEDPSLPAGEKDLLAHYAQTVSRWAMVQRVVQAVRSQEAQPLPIERVQQIDAAWQRGEDPEGLASGLAKSDCSQALQALMAANAGYAEAFVADDRGALVCMSQRTSDYWQGDEPKWSRSYADGAGAVFVSKPDHDNSTGLDLVHISVPVRAAGKVIGVLIVGRIVTPG